MKKDFQQLDFELHMAENYLYEQTKNLTDPRAKDKKGVRREIAKTKKEIEQLKEEKAAWLREKYKVTP